VTGEGGSGGALAIAVGDRVNILENGFYSVISPGRLARASSGAIRPKPRPRGSHEDSPPTDLKELGIVDEIVKEAGRRRAYRPRGLRRAFLEEGTGPATD
jgi:acetyl-CoA carboxylase carboxyl transferase subunit beta